MPLPQPLLDTIHFSVIDGPSAAQSAVHQPNTLRQEDEEQDSGQDLRPAEAFAGKKLAHGQRRVFYHVGGVRENSP